LKSPNSTSTIHLDGHPDYTAEGVEITPRARTLTQRDNIFVERLWRSLKYECVYLHAWETGSEAKAGVGRWIEFYSCKRPHSALGGKPPAVVYWLRKDETQPDQQEQRVP